VPTLLAGYKLWIPAHIVNFALVPNRQVGGLVGGLMPAGQAAALSHALLQGICRLGTVAAKCAFDILPAALLQRILYANVVSIMGEERASCPVLPLPLPWGAACLEALCCCSLAPQQAAPLPALPPAELQGHTFSAERRRETSPLARVRRGIPGRLCLMASCSRRTEPPIAC
jgi:hypothetical protein